MAPYFTRPSERNPRITTEADATGRMEETSQAYKLRSGPLGLGAAWREDATLKRGGLDCRCHNKGHRKEG